VADLLAHHYGLARRNTVMDEVRKPQVDDQREVRLTAAEIQRLLGVCDPDTRDLIALAMLLAVDQGPLLMLTPRLFQEDLGVLEVRDTKTAARPRVLEVSTPALAILRRRAAGLGPDARLFDWTPGQVRHRFEAARDVAAGRPSRSRRERGSAEDPIGAEAERLLESHRIVTLPVLRFKDLRHLLPTAWNALGLPPEDLKGIMGWAEGSNMAGRYTTARIAGDRENLDRVAAFLGLDRLHLAAG
jgi:integrase